MLLSLTMALQNASFTAFAESDISFEGSTSEAAGEEQAESSALTGENAPEDGQTESSSPNEEYSQEGEYSPDGEYAPEEENAPEGAQTESSSQEEENAPEEENAAENTGVSGTYTPTFDHLYFNDGLVESMDFSNKRLLVGTDDSSIFTWDTNIISEYGGVYLLDFAGESEAMSAYTYYYDIADFVESDISLFVADDDYIGSIPEENAPADALSQLRVLLDSGFGAYGQHYDIALIDTGVTDDLTAAVSVIGESAADDNGHGTRMLEAVRSISPELSVLSVKAFDGSGTGSMSSVYAAMVFAAEQDVDVIDLSFAARSIKNSAALERAVSMAQDAGIIVVGAAGNDSADVSEYLPGRTAGVYIAGACDETGARYFASNYGENVFCNVVAGSTSEAAAKLSAFIAAYGLEQVYREMNKGVIFEKDYTAEDIEYADHTKVKETEASDSPYLERAELEQETLDVIDGIKEETLTFADDPERSDTPEFDKDTPPVQKSVSAGSVTIDHVYVRWLTSSTGEDTPAAYGDLTLNPDTAELSNQQFQINFVLSGKEPYKPGDIEITFPAYIWKDREGEEYGSLTLSVPSDPTTGAEFVWKRLGDGTIVVTNAKNIDAASTIMLQGTFRNMDATKIRDITDSSDLKVKVTVKSPDSEENAVMESNAIRAHINTKVLIDRAEKTAYNYLSDSYDIWWNEIPADMPVELLAALPAGAKPEDYGYIRWYAAGQAGGSQPFKMYVEDTVENQYGGIMLGVSQCIPDGENDENVKPSANPKGVYYKLSDEDSTHVRALIYDGYTTATQMAYIWTAYKRDEFPEEMTDVPNTVSIWVEGTDDSEDEYIHEDATSTVHTKKPQTYTFTKVWDDNGNKAGHRPTRMNLIIRRYEDEDGSPAWRTVTLTKEKNQDPNDPDKWIYQWSDEGTDSHFYLTESPVGNNFSGIEDEKFDGQSHQLRWRYYQSGQTPDTKSPDFEPWAYNPDWEFVNTYDISWGTTDISNITKTTDYIYDDIKTESRRDSLSLNKLLRDEEIIVPYYINTTISAAEQYLTPNPDRDNNDKTLTRTHDFIMEDPGFTLYHYDSDANESKELDLSAEDMDISSVVIRSAAAYRYLFDQAAVDPDADATVYPSYQPMEENVILWGRQGNNGEWVQLANHQARNEWTSADVDGVEVIPDGNRISATVKLPKGFTGFKITCNEDAAYVIYNCVVNVRINPTPNVKSIIESSFEGGSENYRRFELKNTAYIHTEYTGTEELTFNGESYGAGSIYSEMNTSSHAYLHGRPYRVAAELDKTFEVVVGDQEDAATNDNKIKKRVLLHSTLTLTQQSNITENDPDNGPYPGLEEYMDVINNNEMPNALSGTFYDLLPPNVDPDIDSIRLADGESGTIENAYVINKGANRKMLVVKVSFDNNISYTKADTSKPNEYVSTVHPYDPDYPIEGYKNTHTIEFDSYISYDDAYNPNNFNELLPMRNVAAFESNEDTIGNIHGWAGEPDDPVPDSWEPDDQLRGNNHKESRDAVGGDSGLMTGLHSARSGHNAFVYAGADLAYDNIDIDATTGLRKKVQAAGSGIWSSGHAGAGSSTEEDAVDVAVNVQENGLYTYSLTVMPDDQTQTKDIIILDFIENYTPTTAEEPNDWDWKGTLVGVDLSPLEKLDVEPVVFYSTNDFEQDYIDQYYSGDASDPNNPNHNTIAERLEGGLDGWKVLTETTDLSTVKAIAFDLRKKKSDPEADFIITHEQRVTVYLQMKAPYQQTAAGVRPGYFGQGDADPSDPNQNAHAFNDVYMSCEHTSEDAKNFSPENLHYPYTKVGIFTKYVNVEKIWDDDDDRDGLQPGSIDIILKNGDEEVQRITVSKDTDWKGQFDRMLTYDKNGNYIEYTFDEEFNDYPGDMDKYKMSYYTEMRDGTLTVVMKNTYEPLKLTRIPVEKKWLNEDGEEYDIYRDTDMSLPESITVRLKENGVYTGRSITIYPDSAGNWYGEFTDLFVNDHGDPIEYTIEEERIDDYVFVPEDSTIKYDPETEGFTFELCNRYKPYGDLIVTKTAENVTKKAADTQFEFTLELWVGAEKNSENGLPGQYPYEIYNTSDLGNDNAEPLETGFISNNVTFRLKGGQSIVIKNIPTHKDGVNGRENVRYAVTEANTNGFELTSAVMKGASEGRTNEILSWDAAEMTFINTYESRGDTPVEAVKILNGRTLDSYQFRFDLYEYDFANKTKGAFVRSGNNAADGSVTVGRLGYTNADLNAAKDLNDQPTELWYLMEEYNPDPTKESVNGYTYSDAVYLVKVTLEDQGNGKIRCNAYYFYNDFDEYDEPIEIGFIEVGEDKHNKPVFINTYSASDDIPLTAWKLVDGGELGNDKFTFVLIDEDSEVIATAKNDPDGVITFADIHFTEADAGKTRWFFAHEKNDGKEKYVYTDAIIAYGVSVVDNGNGTLSFDQSAYIVTDRTAFTECGTCGGTGEITREIEGSTETETVDCTVCGGFGYKFNKESWTAPQPDERDVPIFTNGLKNGSLTIAKQIDPESETNGNTGAGVTFKFKVKLIGDKITEDFELTDSSGTPYTVDENGEFTVEITGAGTVSFEDQLPAGTSYQIMEETEKGWDLIAQDNTTGVIRPLESSDAVLTNLYSPDQTSAVITGIKFLDNQPAAEGSFSFTLTEEGSTYTDTVSVGEGGFFQFRIVYTEPGDHTYYITENNGGDSTINYDDSRKTVTVSVKRDDEDSPLYATVTYEAGENNGVRFYNTTKDGALRINKAVLGSPEYEPGNEPEFTFKISFANKNGMPVTSNDLKWYIEDANGNPIENSGSGTVSGEAQTEVNMNMSNLRYIKTFNSKATVALNSDEVRMNDDAPMAIADIINTPTLNAADGETLYQNNSYGISGTQTDGVMWSIIQKGSERILQLEPVNGVEGTLGTWAQGTFADPGINCPWYNYRTLITSIRIHKKVYTAVDGNGGLFAALSALQTANLDGLDVSKTTASFYRAFSSCGKLTYVNFEGVTFTQTSNLSYLFENCYALTTIDGLSTLIDYSEHNNIAQLNLEDMFFNCQALKSVDVSGWHLPSECGSINMEKMFSQCYALTKATGFKNLDTSCVTNVSNMFGNCTALTSIDSPTHVDLSGWDLRKATTVSQMFWNCNNVTKFDLSNWQLGSPSGLGNLFSSSHGNMKVVELDLSNWRVESADLSSLCTTMKSLTTVNISNLECETLTSTSNMFYNCSSLTDSGLNISNWKIKSGTCNMSYMFYGCSSLTSIDLNSWDFNPTRISSMNSMFSGCKNLATLDLGAWTLGSGTGTCTMITMFYGCESFTTLDLSYWKFGSVQVSAMDSMFSGCKNLVTLDLGAWQIGPDTATGTCTMEGTFKGCTSLKTIKTTGADNDLSTWKFGGVQVTTMKSMFADCTALETLNMSNWKLGTCTTGAMFQNCSALTDLDISNWSGVSIDVSTEYRTSVVEDGKWVYYYNYETEMMEGCTALKTLNISGWSFTASPIRPESFIILTDSSNFEKLIVDMGFYSAVYQIILPDFENSPYTGKWVEERNLKDPKAPAYIGSIEFYYINANGDRNDNPPIGTYVRQIGCYEVAFDPNEAAGGTGSMPNVTSYCNEKLTLPSNKFTNGTKEFTGWKVISCTDAEGTEQTTHVNDIYIADSNGIASIDPNTFPHGATVILEAQWADEVTYVYFDVIIEEEDVYTKGVFHAASTTRIGIQEAAFDASGNATITPAPRDGFITPDVTATVNKDGTGTPVRFQYRRKRYMIYFDGNGGTGSMAPIEMAVGVGRRIENEFINADGAFTGWLLRGTEIFFSGLEPISISGADDGDEYTLIAQWLDVIRKDEIKGDITITIKAGQTIVFTALPAGTEYTIEEISLPEGWTQVFNGASGIINGTIMPDTLSRHTVTNRYSLRTTTAKIQAHKLLEGGTLSEDEFGFQLSTDPEKLFRDTAEFTSSSAEDRTELTGDYNIIKTYDGATSLDVTITSLTAPGGESTLSVYGSRDDSTPVAEGLNTLPSGSYTISGNTVRFAGHYAEYEAKITAHYLNITERNSVVDDIYESWDEDLKANVKNPWYGMAAITFDGLTFTKAGDYTFYIRELGPVTDPEHADDYPDTIEYDASTREVTVKVKDNGDGTLSVADIIYPEVTYPAYDETYDKPVKGAVFCNKIKPGNLMVTKKLQNATDAAYEKDFEFTVNFTGTITDGDYEAEIVIFDETDNTYTHVSDETFTVTNGTGKFSIKGGQSYIIKGLPDGIYYSITEAEMPSFIQIEPNGAAEGTIESNKTKKEEFVNLYFSGMQLPLIAKKIFIGGEIEEEMFLFGLYTSSGTLVTTAYANKDGNIPFVLDFDETYANSVNYYYIEEITTDPNSKDIRYDKHRVDIKVIIDNDLNITVEYDEEDMTFENIKLFEFEVLKTVDETFGKKDQPFEFTLELTEGDYSLEDLTYTTSDGETHDLTLTDGKYTFYLKHGEKIVFGKIPYGTKYTITESEYNKYKTTITVAGDITALTEGRTVSGIIQDKVTAAYYNEMIPALLPSAGGTGTAMFTASGILLLLSAAALTNSKRRRQKKQEQS